MTRLIGATNTGNDIRIRSLFYQFPFLERGTVAIAPAFLFPHSHFPRS
ncbi:MAG: hypothetical protein WBA39_31220 [Rivularia sp. (in: cyanobacteria)]